MIETAFAAGFATVIVPVNSTLLLSYLLFVAVQVNVFSLSGAVLKFAQLHSIARLSVPFSSRTTKTVVGSVAITAAASGL